MRNRPAALSLRRRRLCPGEGLSRPYCPNWKTALRRERNAAFPMKKEEKKEKKMTDLTAPVGAKGVLSVPPSAAFDPKPKAAKGGMGWDSTPKKRVSVFRRSLAPEGADLVSVKTSPGAVWLRRRSNYRHWAETENSPVSIRFRKCWRVVFMCSFMVTMARCSSLASMASTSLR